MTREQEMVLFEQACADWGFDFTKNSDGPNGLIYNDYNTGCMFGMFSKGFETAVKECADYLDAFNRENMVEEGIGGAELKQHFGVEE